MATKTVIGKIFGSKLAVWAIIFLVASVVIFPTLLSILAANPIIFVFIILAVIIIGIGDD